MQAQDSCGPEIRVNHCLLPVIKLKTSRSKHTWQKAKVALENRSIKGKSLIKKCPTRQA
jgi:hypothetical protein